MHTKTHLNAGQSKNLKPMVKTNPNGGTQTAFKEKKQNAAPLDPYNGVKNKSAFDILTNAKNATASAANALQKAIFHSGRVGKGTSKGPR